MKNAIILILSAATFSLAVVCVVQTQKSSTQKTQLAALRGEAEVRSQQLEELRAARKRFEHQRQELMSQAEELAAQLQARQFAATNIVVAAPPPAPAAESEKPAEEKGGFGAMLSKMMQDPDTREMIRTQQRMMVDQMYGPLIKRLGLTPEDAAKFKELLTDNMMSAADKASSLFGAMGSTNSSEAIKGMTAQQKSFDEQVKSFLGEDGYAQYKDYQETMGERTLLNRYKMQAGSDYNLNDQQTEALLTIMKEEKKNVAAATGLPLADNSNDPAKLQAMLSGDKLDQYLQAQDSVNQRVYQRAQTFLSPDQLNTLSRFQTNQTQMMRMGMGMMRKMFSPGQADAATPPAGQ